MALAWYVLHTYSGHENKVKLSLEQRVKAMGMADKISQILVPTQEVLEFRSGKKKKSTRTSFPGYVLIKMDMFDELWYIVKNTPGVMGFLGTEKKPVPIDDSEVENIMKSAEHGLEEEKKHALDLIIGDRAKIVDGPFTGFSGVIDEINDEKTKLKLMISIFGRSTPVELEFAQVKKLE
ncbi:transcription termination/antitermination factor NusG [Candidatus Poribacteria bacterium]|nr:transcription termination/antitermination factor NusG [Candidatus Poribacteria bacterium]